LKKRPAFVVDEAQLATRGVSRWSALSSRSISRYSARLVNMR
jgi:hypothetical protein